MKKIAIASTLALTLALSGASFAGSMSYADTVAAAKKEMKVAKQMGHLWRDTGKILKKADKAKKAGDSKKAMKLAMKALNQARDAQKQAKAQANPKVRY